MTPVMIYESHSDKHFGEARMSDPWVPTKPRWAHWQHRQVPFAETYSFIESLRVSKEACYHPQTTPVETH